MKKKNKKKKPAKKSVAVKESPPKGGINIVVHVDSSHAGDPVVSARRGFQNEADRSLDRMRYKNFEV